MNDIIKKLKHAFRQPLFWLLIFLMIVPASMSLTGRYSSLPHNDLVQDTMNAWNLVHHGEFPKHSGISTYFGMIPPGISYAFVPGALVFPGNPTAGERLGAALMFAGTLIGLYLWLNKRLGAWPTALAMLIFAVGKSGLFYAYSLWPRGHVFFVVWFLYFLTLWVERRKASWLGAALVVFIASTYWFMELVPLFIVLPVLYFLYKPPLGIRAIAAAFALGLLIWLPYLAFEYPRGFIDLRALVTQKVLVKAYSIGEVVTDKNHYIVNSWEVPNLKEQAAKNGGHLARQTGFWLKTSPWGTVWAETETRYYLGEPGFVFYHPGFNEWCFQSFASGRVLRPNRTVWEPGSYPVDFPKELMRIPATSTSAATTHDLPHFAPFYNVGVGRNCALFYWHLALLFFAAGYVTWRGYCKGEISGACRAWLGIFRRAKTRPPMPAADNARLVWTVIAAALILPLVIQCALVKSWDGLFTSERRFVWLWLIEAVAIGAMLGTARWRGRRVGIALGFFALLTLAANPNMRIIATQAYSSLPGNYRSDEDKALDALADLIKAEGKTSAKIGYDLNQNQWMFFVRPIDGVSKCAIDWDVVLLLRHGITNLDTTPEGLAADDDFRVYDPNYDVPHESYWRSRWNMTFDGSFQPMETVAEIGRYQILRPAKITGMGKN